MVLTALGMTISRSNLHCLNAFIPINLTEGGIWICSIDVKRNAFSPISSSPSPRLTFVNRLHELNVPTLIDLMALGMIISCRNSQQRNACSPIFSSPLPRVTLINCDLKNAQFPITLTALGITISCIDVQLSNERSPISSREKHMKNAFTPISSKSSLSITILKSW
jgi:hypothetical protein